VSGENIAGQVQAAGAHVAVEDDDAAEAYPK
jgi:hypothetical protein